MSLNFVTGRRVGYALACLALCLGIFAIGGPAVHNPAGVEGKAEGQGRGGLPDLGLPPQSLPHCGSPWNAAVFAHRDSLTLPKEEAPYFRYLWLPYEKEYLTRAYVILKYHANRLSRVGKFGEPHLVTQDLIRLDVRDYGWEEFIEVWENFAKIDHVFHQKAVLKIDAKVEAVWPGGKEDGKFYEAGVYESVPKKAGDTVDIPARWLPQREMHELRHRLLTEAPILMSSWWFVQTARQVSIRNVDEGVGYYNWLGLKKRDDMFALAGVNEKVATDRYVEWRAVVRRSGISQQSRIVLALGAQVHGRVWGTLDTITQKGRGQPLRNLRRGEFKHNAEEWYFFLSNGLDGNYLCDNNGTAQASAPDTIGPDDSSLRAGHDSRVHVNIGCVRCHGYKKDMLQPFTDAVRRLYRAGGPFRLQDPNKQVFLELESQYLRDIDEHLNDDRAKFVRAIARCTATTHRPQGLSCVQITDLYGGEWNRYVEQTVTVSDAARELGVTKELLQERIWLFTKARGGNDLILSEFIDHPPQSITRLEWEDSYALAATLCYGIHPQGVIEKAENLLKKKEGK